MICVHLNWKIKRLLVYCYEWHFVAAVMVFRRTFDNVLSWFFSSFHCIKTRKTETVSTYTFLKQLFLGNGTLFKTFPKTRTHKLKLFWLKWHNHGHLNKKFNLIFQWLTTSWLLQGTWSLLTAPRWFAINLWLH